MSADTFPSFWQAEHDFVGDHKGAQLSFKKGDTFLMIERHESGWFTAERNGEQGYVPGNFFTKIEVSKREPPQSRSQRSQTTFTTENRVSGGSQFTSAPVLEIPTNVTCLISDDNSNLPKTRKTTSGLNGLRPPQHQTHRRSLSNPKPKPPMPTIIPTLYKPNQSAAPPIPLRTDLGEVETIPEPIPETAKTVNLEIIQAGNIINSCKQNMMNNPILILFRQHFF